MRKFYYGIIIFFIICARAYGSDDILINAFGESLSPEYLGKDTEYQTPFYVISSSDDYPSPVIIIDGGMHGDEVAGTYACDELLKNLKVIKGTLVIIPRLNKPACDRNYRTRQAQFVQIYDLNRNFPGDTRRDMSNYEALLADDFTALIKEFSPDLVLNLHEDKDFNDEQVNRYDCEDHYLGQVIITCRGRCDDFDFDKLISDTTLLKAQELINTGLADDHKFTIINLPSAPEKGYSQDYFYEVLGIDSYTVETYRNGSFGSGAPIFEYGYEEVNRVKLQIITCLSFLEVYGVEYEYAQEDWLNRLTMPERY